MEGLYQAVYMIIAIMILGVLPYLIFYYEAENPEGRNYQCWTAVKYEALTVLISLTVVVIMWVFLGKADVPLTEYVFNSTESERSSAAAHGLLSADDSCASPDACGLPADLRAGLPLVLRVSVTPVVYLMAMISFVGWFFFVLFGVAHEHSCDSTPRLSTPRASRNQPCSPQYTPHELRRCQYFSPAAVSPQPVISTSWSRPEAPLLWLAEQ